MMKKKYIQPQVKVNILKNSAILAASGSFLTVGGEPTSEQNAKEFLFVFEDDDINW